MKIKKLAVVATLVLFGFTALASNNNKANQKNQMLLVQDNSFSTYLSENITYPQAAKDKLIEGCVSAEINIDNEGQFCIKAINGHPLLIESVKQQIESINCDCLDFIVAPESIVKINFQIE